MEVILIEWWGWKPVFRELSYERWKVETMNACCEISF